ncbi:hypothetical protein T05_9058 [Trichinella murrelli]|uniref:Uncharacterized protein n=1 Tax=Trichinella murrelli TaxID=144512 RepID=A0A0V0T9U8_9BILA|nr:hypothetical protein T05_9058 [Trichinella murrelli]
MQPHTAVLNILFQCEHFKHLFIFDQLLIEFKKLNSTSPKERCPLTRHSAADSALVEASLLDTILGIKPYFSCITSCITLSIRSIAAVEQRALGQQGSNPISPVRYWQYYDLSINKIGYTT